MNIEESKLLYVRGMGAEEAGKIKIDFLKKLFSKFSENFGNIVDVISANHGAPFNERQSYGIFVKSIPDEPSENDFVLTEVSLLRGEENSSKGRIDFFIFYRGWLLLVELKLGRTSITTNENADKKLSDRWCGALKQIEGIPIDGNPVLNEFVRRLKAKGVIKIPIMIVIYHENCRNEYEFSDIDNAKGQFEKRFSQLDGQMPSYKYRYFKSIENKEHRRLKNEKHKQLIRGISFFAGIDNDVFSDF